jgi:hypothetical protein
MGKDEYVALLDGAFANGTPFINYTEFYSYALIPQGGGKWLEVSYDYEDHEIMDKKEIDDVEAYNRLCEEVEKAMCEEIEDFMLVHWKEFKGGLGEAAADNVVASIAELTSNPTKYSKDLPLVTGAGDLDKVKAKL